MLLMLVTLLIVSKWGKLFRKLFFDFFTSTHLIKTSVGYNKVQNNEYFNYAITTIEYILGKYKSGSEKTQFEFLKWKTEIKVK